MSSPVPAGTLILVRDGAGGLEVLLGRRTDRGQFGGAHVFPGGLVDAIDRRDDAPVVGGGDGDRPFMVAAVRETAEEVGLFVVNGPVPPGAVGATGAALFAVLQAAGVAFDLDRLRFVSNWVTPEVAPRRYDTRFFIARGDDLPPPSTPTGELADVEWVRPADALARADTARWSMVLPTRAHLERLAEFSDAASAVDTMAGSASRRTTMPRPVETPDGIRFVVPDEVGEGR